MKEKNDIYSFLDFAESIEESKRRADLYRHSDPFKDIYPALLNKTDIAKYVAKTGMLHPFEPKKLKPASYEVKLGDEVLYWDENGEKQYFKNLSKRNSVIIRQNSITYVSVETIFKIPFYIALRFNLSITHVHRGLLLGTGPLIDPGFKGKLMIPIHNLTTNDYTIRPGDDLIAVEFTKLSPDDTLKEEDNLEKKLYGMNVKKPDLSFDDYIEDAIKPLTSVESSLEQTIGKAKKEVDEAKKHIEEIRQESHRTARIITWAGIFVAATLVISSLAVFFQTKSLVSDANKYVSDAVMLVKKNDKGDLDIRNFAVRGEVNSLKSEITQLANEIELIKEGKKRDFDESDLAMRSDVDALKTEIIRLREEINRLKEDLGVSHEGTK